MRKTGDGRNVAGLWAFVMCLALLPAWAHAQSIRPSVTGMVTDSSGAVLPGVTVEVASPALIEKVRTAVTDGSGQLPHPRSPAWRLHGDVHAARVRHRQTGRPRAIGLERRQVECADARRRTAGNGHGPRRKPDGRRPDPAGSRRCSARKSLTDMPIERTATAMASVLVPAMNSGLSAYGAAGTTGPETGRLQVDGVGVGIGHVGHVPIPAGHHTGQRKW